MKPSRFGLAVLISGSLFCVFLLWQALATEDAIERLFGATIGGIAACLLLPFWVLYRGPVPFRTALIAALLGVISVPILNAWACWASGTRLVNPLDHAWLLLFCIPGAIAVWRSRRRFA